MRAIGIRSFGGPERVEALVVDTPSPVPGHVLVRVSFAGLNAIDAHVRRGAFLGRDAKPAAWPMLLGYEAAGTVEAVGSGVEGIRSGDRVAWCGVPGAQAEFALVPAWRLSLVPDRMPLDIACALQLDGMQAHAFAVSVFPIKADDVVLIHSGASPAALLLIQIAKAQGATVVATVARTVDVGGPKVAGADRVVVLTEEAALERIREGTGGSGCNVVYDSLGEDTIAISMASCRRRGVIVLHGGEGTRPVDVVRPEALAAAGSLYLTRAHLPDYMQDGIEVRWRMDGLFDAWLQQRLSVGVGRILPLEAAREGHLAIEAGTAAGKILLKL